MSAAITVGSTAAILVLTTSTIANTVPQFPMARNTVHRSLRNIIVHSSVCYDTSAFKKNIMLVPQICPVLYCTIC